VGEKALEVLREARGGGDKVSGPGCDESFSVQLRGEGVAHALKPGVVTARADERGDTRVAEDPELWAGFFGEASAMRAADSTRDVVGQRSVIDSLGACHLQELAQQDGVCGEAVGEDRVARLLEPSDVRIRGRREPTPRRSA